MKLLLFSDLHADAEAARAIAAQAPGVDALVGAGDYGNIRRDLFVCMKVLRGIDKPAILVAGNNESTEELEDACRDWPSARVLHGTGTNIGGVDFFGIGGGIPVTPFGAWSYDFDEDQAASLLAGCPAGCVLVSHSPPLGAVDVSSQGKSLGSRSVREAVDRLKPHLVVCGHIHACSGQRANLGATPVVNAGPRGILWELAI